MIIVWCFLAISIMLGFSPQRRDLHLYANRIAIPCRKRQMGAVPSTSLPVVGKQQVKNATVSIPREMSSDSSKTTATPPSPLIVGKQQVKNATVSTPNKVSSNSSKTTAIPSSPLIAGKQQVKNATVSIPREMSSDSSKTTAIPSSPLIVGKQQVKNATVSTPNKVSSDSSKTTAIPSSPLIAGMRQQKLDATLQRVYEHQLNINSSDVIVVYEVLSNCGFGNMIRGYFTTMLVVLLYNVPFKVQSYQDFFRTLFFNPFPNTGAPIYRADVEKKEWELECYKSFEEQRHALPIKQGEKTDVVIATYCDMILTMYSSKSDSMLRQLGLLPSDTTALDINVRKRELHAILLRLLFNPSPELCQLINSYTRQFDNAFVIGLQFRMGGKLVNANDPKFLSKKRVVEVVNEVKTLIRSRNSTQPVIVFVSTDAIRIRQYVVKAFSAPVRVMYVKEFTIGHTALMYKYRLAVSWERIMKQAITDMMVLKECDYLAVSERSSFGKLAAELQQSYGLSVSVDWFLKEHGLRCSVFTRKKSVGVSRLICSPCSTNTLPIQIFH